MTRSLATRSFDEYAAIKAVNWSTLKELGRSELHYAYRLAHPPEDNPRMAFGRAAHCAVLEPDRFPVDFTVFDGYRRGNAWTEFAAANASKTILTVDEYDRCLALRDSVRAHRSASRLLRVGRPEVTLTWTDPVSHIKAKARLDWYSPFGLLDLKTTRDVEARKFGRLATGMGYPQQLAFYRAGLTVLGLPCPAVRIIAVEAEGPHDVAVYELDDDVMYAASEMVAELLDHLRQMRRRKSRPGQYPEALPLDVPAWYFDAPTTDDELVLLGLKEKRHG